MQFGGNSQLGGTCKMGGGDSLTLEYYRLFKSDGISPPGVYNKDDSTLRNQLLLGDAHAVERGRRTAEAVDLNFIPGDAYESLAEWESDFGIILPDSATLISRQADCAARWLAAAAPTVLNFKKAIAGVLNSPWGFRDKFDDDVITPQINVVERVGSVDELTDLIQCLLLLTAHGRFDPGGIGAPTWTIPLCDRSDDWVFAAQYHASVQGDDTGFGIFVQDKLTSTKLDSIILEHYKTATDEGTRARRLYCPVAGSTIVEDVFATESGVYPAVGEWFVIRKTGNTYSCEIGATAEGGTVIGTTETPYFAPREVGGFCCNQSATWNGVWWQADECRLIYAKPENNVEFIEHVKATVGDAEDIFTAFVWRDPEGAGFYDLLAAQLILNKIKQAHTLITVGESKEFRTDDSFSLTDRDVIAE